MVSDKFIILKEMKTKVPGPPVWLGDILYPPPHQAMPKPPGSILRALSEMFAQGPQVPAQDSYIKLQAQ